VFTLLSGRIFDTIFIFRVFAVETGQPGRNCPVITKGFFRQDQIDGGEKSRFNGRSIAVSAVKNGFINSDRF